MRLLCLCLLLGVAQLHAQQETPFQTWQTDKGGHVLTLFVNFAAGAPLKAASIGEAVITKDNQGFVTMQVPLSNPSGGRKAAKIKWDWKKTNGMAVRSPLGNTLRLITIPGKDKTVIQSVSSTPNPQSVTLTIYPAK